MEAGASDVRASDDAEMTEDRRVELLRRVLQHDVEDAVARYEAEAGCCVVDLNLHLVDPDRFVMELKTDPRISRRSVPPPLPRMLVFNFGR